MVMCILVGYFIVKIRSMFVFPFEVFLTRFMHNKHKKKEIFRCHHWLPVLSRFADYALV